MAKREHYSHTIANEKKKQRRKQAECRQQQRNGRSNAQQLCKLDAGVWAAVKERARLRG